MLKAHLVLICQYTSHAGFYETRIAYHTWRGHPGFDYSAIPSY